MTATVDIQTEGQKHRHNKRKTTMTSKHTLPKSRRAERDDSTV